MAFKAHGWMYDSWICPIGERLQETTSTNDLQPCGVLPFFSKVADIFGMIPKALDFFMTFKAHGWMND